MRGAENTAEQQLRAYIHPTVTEIKKFSLTEPIEISVTLENAGQTPARDCECTGTGFIAALPLDDNATMPDPTEAPGIGRHSKQAIYPHAVRSIDCPSIDILGPEYIKLIRAQKVAIYVAGEVRYKDVFGIKRRSEFCFYIDNPHALLLIAQEQGKNVTIPSEINFVSAHVWNRFT